MRAGSCFALLSLIVGCSTPEPQWETVQGDWALPLVETQKAAVQEPGRLYLQVSDFEESSFDRFGFWDGSGAFEHAYGGNAAGSFTYVFRLREVPLEQLEVQARLSAESTAQGLPEEKSEVDLRINGQSLGRQTVVADDGQGLLYTWKINGRERIKKLRLKADERNILSFIVASQARYKNGLCIYGRPGQPIALLMDTP